MNIRRLSGPIRKINRVVKVTKCTPPKRKEKRTLPTERETWEYYYAERNYFFGDKK